MKKLILPFVLGAMMVSCSRDNDDAGLTPNPNNPTTPAETPVLLTKVVNTEENGDVETTQFEYDGDKVTKISISARNGTEAYEAVYTYTGDLITFIKQKEGDGETSETTIAYDDQKRLKTSTKISRGNTTVSTYTRHYTHNADGTVVVREIRKREYINGSFPNTESEKTITYTIVNGLITKVENTESGYTSTDVYTYDDKNGPLKNIRGIKELVLENFDDGGVSSLKHNYTSVVSGQETYSYSYEYNANGYPKKVTAAYPNGRGATSEFFYNK